MQKDKSKEKQDVYSLTIISHCVQLIHMIHLEHRTAGVVALPSGCEGNCSTDVLSLYLIS